MFAITETFMVDYIHQSIEDGSAVQIDGQSFIDGDEGQFHIEFFMINATVVRREYNRHSTITVFHEIDGENRERLVGAAWPQS